MQAVWMRWHMIVIVIVGMQTMKFRRSRVVILVLLLITLSSMGYWLMYVTSRPQSDLSELHDYVDTHHRYRHKHVPERDTDHIDSHGHDSHGHDSHGTKDRNSFQHNELLDRHTVVTHAAHRGSELKENDKYDYSDEQETIDEAMPAMNDETAAAAAGRQHGHKDNKIPEDNKIPVAAQSDDEYDDYDDTDDRNLHEKLDEQNSVKNEEKVSAVDGVYKTASELGSEQGQRKLQVDSMGDDRRQHGDRAMIDQRAAADAVELRQKQDGGGAKQLTSTTLWKEDNELREVDIGGRDAQPPTSYRDKTREQRDEVWRSQQLNDGVRASHLRSHNVAPVPRAYGNSLLENVATQTPQQTTLRSGFDDVLNNIDNIGSPRRSMDSTSSNYFIVHSGSASRVNGVMHPNLQALPNDVQPEAYIFTSDRSVLEKCAHFIAFLPINFSD